VAPQGKTFLIVRWFVVPVNAARPNIMVNHLFKWRARGIISPLGLRQPHFTGAILPFLTVL
jgi:hypothetical protein